MQNNLNNNEISSLAVNPEAANYKDIFYELEQLIGQDVTRVKDFVQKGIITQEQGQYLYNQLVKKAKTINDYKNAQKQQLNINNQPQPVPNQTPEENPMDLFNKEHPGFFETEGRGDILNYIKSYDMDKDEIFKIATMVENLEKAAVDAYLKKSKYEKSLNDENAIAKSKLTAYAQNPAFDGNYSRIYTREEIGNMSGKEFTKNEEAIMTQLRNGLIK